MDAQVRAVRNGWLPFYPQFKESSLETIKKAAEKFKTIPVSIMNFVEGTRLTPQKQEKLRSPYQHLLKPKARFTRCIHKKIETLI